MASAEISGTEVQCLNSRSLHLAGLTEPVHRVADSDFTQVQHLCEFSHSLNSLWTSSAKCPLTCSKPHPLDTLGHF